MTNREASSVVEKHDDLVPGQGLLGILISPKQIEANCSKDLTTVAYLICGPITARQYFLYKYADKAANEQPAAASKTAVRSFHKPISIIDAIKLLSRL